MGEEAGVRPSKPMRPVEPSLRDCCDMTHRMFHSVPPLRWEWRHSMLSSMVCRLHLTRLYKRSAHFRRTVHTRSGCSRTKQFGIALACWGCRCDWRMCRREKSKVHCILVLAAEEAVALSGKRARGNADGRYFPAHTPRVKCTATANCAH